MNHIYEKLIKQESILHIKEEHKFHEVRVFYPNGELKRRIPPHDLRERFWKRFFFELTSENPHRPMKNKQKERELAL